MRAISSAASIAIHAGLGAAFLFGTSQSTPVNAPLPIDTVPIWVQPRPSGGGTDGALGAPVIDPLPTIDLSAITRSMGVLQPVAPLQPFFSTDWTPNAGSGGGSVDGWGVMPGGAAPELLSGPLPIYPDLLRQAGVEGQVVLEALVDSTGRVLARSIAVISASNPGFIEPARRSLLASLFRPARVNGHAVTTLVRVPFAFSIRGGTGRAR